MLFLGLFSFNKPLHLAVYYLPYAFMSALLSFIIVVQLYRCPRQLGTIAEQGIISLRAEALTELLSAGFDGDFWGMFLCLVK